jgi:uncharacterized protein
MAKTGKAWHRYALIAELANLMEESNKQLGKTTMQKMVYLLDSIYNVPSGYNFSLYLYGPYSSDLMYDLGYVENLGGVKIDEALNGGYCITKNDNYPKIIEKANNFLDIHRPQIKKAIAEFGDYNVRELELRSTIIFVYNSALASGKKIDFNSLFLQVKEIKPRFPNEEVRSAISELQEKGFLKAFLAS